MDCPQCGKTRSERNDSRFCSHCGAEFEPRRRGSQTPQGGLRRPGPWWEDAWDVPTHTEPASRRASANGDAEGVTATSGVVPFIQEQRQSGASYEQLQGAIPGQAVSDEPDADAPWPDMAPTLDPFEEPVDEVTEEPTGETAEEPGAVTLGGESLAPVHLPRHDGDALQPLEGARLLEEGEAPTEPAEPVGDVEEWQPPPPPPVDEPIVVPGHAGDDLDAREAASFLAEDEAPTEPAEPVGDVAPAPEPISPHDTLDDLDPEVIRQAAAPDATPIAEPSVAPEADAGDPETADDTDEAEAALASSELLSASAMGAAAAYDLASHHGHMPEDETPRPRRPPEPPPVPRTEPVDHVAETLGASELLAASAMGAMAAHDIAEEELAQAEEEQAQAEREAAARSREVPPPVEAPRQAEPERPVPPPTPSTPPPPATPANGDAWGSFDEESGDAFRSLFHRRFGRTARSADVAATPYQPPPRPKLAFEERLGPLAHPPTPPRQSPPPEPVTPPPSRRTDIDAIDDEWFANPSKPKKKDDDEDADSADQR